MVDQEQKNVSYDCTVPDCMYMPYSPTDPLPETPWMVTEQTSNKVIILYRPDPILTYTLPRQSTAQ